MSRCFPFPPPGYEKKPTTDEPELLKKEKRKEKKHKKDKKDKEKKDGKEKREKDRSEGKHKEKKEKKDKHRDKKKDKDKSRNSTPDEKKILGQFEGYNGEKPHHNNEQNKNGEFNELLQKKEESIKERSIPFRGQNGISVQSRVKVGDAENFKFVQELGRRIRDEEKGMGSHQFAVDVRKNNDNKVEFQKSVGRQSIMDVAGFGGNVTGFAGNVAVLSKINGVTPPPLPPPPLDNKIDKRIDKMQEKGSDDKRGDKRKHKDRDKERQGKSKDREKEKSEKSKEKSERKKAERDKNKHMNKIEPVANPNNVSMHLLENSFQGVANEGNLKKRKDMETNGVSLENELRPNKMARPISNIPPENGRKLDCLQNPSPSLLDKQVASLNSFKVGSQGGQKVNGMIPSQPVSLPAKKPLGLIPSFNHIPSKPSPIKSPPVITNHVAILSPPVTTTKPQPNHIPAQLTTSKPPPPSIPNVIPVQPPPLSSSLPPPPSAKHPVSRPKPPPQPPVPIPKKKPPHPDTKYLNQILSVPKLDPWCDYDDQEWLFSNKSGQPSSKKATTEEVEVQVWSEAKRIESVDICALPYVIPY